MGTIAVTGAASGIGAATAARLTSAGHRVITVDVRSKPQAARKYGVGVVPTAVTVDGSGAVLARLA